MDCSSHILNDMHLYAPHLIILVSKLISHQQPKHGYVMGRLKSSFMKSIIVNTRVLVSNINGKKVSPKSESYRKCLFGYSRIVHRDICTFILVFSHGNKSRAGQGAQ